jgi:putative hemolysin
VRDALPFLEGDGWRESARHGLESALGLKRVRVIFREAAARGGERFAEAFAGFGLRAAGENFATAIPDSGPVVVMANHPFGGADALALGTLCTARRADTLMLANEMAAQVVPGPGEAMIPLSILGGEGSARKNAPSLRRALEHLRNGGLLAVFPSGEVASWKGSAVEEGRWSPHVAALALKSRAALVTVKFHGKTPFWFHLSGGIHPLVRTALLPRVLLCMRGHTVRCRAIRVEREDVASMSAEEAAAFLRKRALEIADGE